MRAKMLSKELAQQIIEFHNEAAEGDFIALGRNTVLQISTYSDFAEHEYEKVKCIFEVLVKVTEDEFVDLEDVANLEFEITEEHYFTSKTELLQFIQEQLLQRSIFAGYKD